jgi:peroxiredoxin Q/BCP
MLDWLFSDPLPVGSPAPDFSLPDDQGNQISLASLRGKNVVLIFYPRDETSVCTQQLCEFRDRWSDVKAKNAVVFGVNPQDAKSHTKFREHQKYPFPLLTDRGQKMAQMYHARGPVIVKRTVYLIDPAGIIRFAARGKPDPAQVLAVAR